MRRNCSRSALEMCGNRLLGAKASDFGAQHSQRGDDRHGRYENTKLDVLAVGGLNPLIVKQLAPAS